MANFRGLWNFTVPPRGKFLFALRIKAVDSWFIASNDAIKKLRIIFCVLQPFVVDFYFVCIWSNEEEQHYTIPLYVFCVIIFKGQWWKLEA